MAIYPQLWGKLEEGLIPFPDAGRCDCGSSEAPLGKSKARDSFGFYPL